MNTLVSPSLRCFLKNLALIGQAVSEKIFEYYGYIQILLYIAGGWGGRGGGGEDQSPGFKLFQNNKITAATKTFPHESLQCKMEDGRILKTI